MNVLIGIVGCGILFLLRVLFAFWREGKADNHRFSVDLIDFKSERERRTVPVDEGRPLSFEARLKSAAMAANAAEELDRLRSTKRAY